LVLNYCKQRVLYYTEKEIINNMLNIKPKFKILEFKGNVLHGNRNPNNFPKAVIDTIEKLKFGQGIFISTKQTNKVKINIVTLKVVLGSRLRFADKPKVTIRTIKYKNGKVKGINIIRIY
jgi:hypothetical protein